MSICRAVALLLVVGSFSGCGSPVPVNTAPVATTTLTLSNPPTPTPDPTPTPEPKPTYTPHPEPTSTEFPELGSLKYNMIVIDYERFEELIDGGRPFFVYIGRDTCSYCRVLTPVLHDFTQFMYETPNYYFDTQYLKTAILEGEEGAQERWDGIKAKHGFEGTPCLMYFDGKGGKEIFPTFVGKDYFDAETVEQKNEIIMAARTKLEKWMIDLKIYSCVDLTCR
ncbi:thioredoxin family protein [Clostridia bacterium OttesenSCG-928-F22]|nr:thioredoxin family protein [Clostridia bacterium OttesenSCG-928-F22]